MSVLQFLLMYLGLGMGSMVIQGYAARRVAEAGREPIKINLGHWLAWPVPTAGSLYVIGKYPKVVSK